LVSAMGSTWPKTLTLATWASTWATTTSGVTTTSAATTARLTWMSATSVAATGGGVGRMDHAGTTFVSRVRPGPGARMPSCVPPGRGASMTSVSGGQTAPGYKHTALRAGAFMQPYLHRCSPVQRQGRRT
jgi:hypothetical protein